MRTVAVATLVGIALAVVMVLKLGYRRTILAGAVLLAVASLVPVETQLAVPAAAATRAMIAVSLIMLLARSNEAAPELRDAWLTAIALSIGTGAFIGQLGGLTLSTTAFGPAIQAALALCIIPLALTLLPAELPEPGAPPARRLSTPVVLGGAAVVLALLALGSRFMVQRFDILDGNVLASSVLSFLIPAGAVLIYTLSHSPEKPERAPQKIVIASIAAVFAVALALNQNFQFTGVGAAYSFFHEVGVTLSVPIALGIAATIPRYTAAVATVAAFKLLEALLRF